MTNPQSAGATGDFAALFEAAPNKLNVRFERGQRVKGTVSSIHSDSVFLDIGGLDDGILDAAEVLNEAGEISLVPGDELECFVLSIADGVIMLTTKMSGEMASAHLSEAYAANIPVEGKFTAERKGGYTVTIGHDEAFCPYSQAGAYVAPGTENALIGQTAMFMITQMKGRDIVVSRRKIMEQEAAEARESLRWSLSVGDIVTGVVRKIMDFGVFVDIGGMDGMIPLSELSWSGKRVQAEEILHVGETVRVQIKALDWDKQRISLSYRGAAGSWSDLLGDLEVGALCEGLVTRIEPFGAFVEIETDVEGLLHISEVGKTLHRRLDSLDAVMQVNDTIIVEVLDIDEERHRISLGYARENLSPEEQAALPAARKTPARKNGKTAEQSESPMDELMLENRLKQLKTEAASFGSMDALLNGIDPASLK